MKTTELFISFHLGVNHEFVNKVGWLVAGELMCQTW